MGLIKSILIFLIVYYSFRFIFRLLAPFFIRAFINKAQRTMNPQEPRKQEGEVSIKKNKSNSQRSSSKNVGEYVDFEEIDEKNKPS